MKKYFETKGFKALQREWYQKAADDGFRDLESADGEFLAQSRHGDDLVPFERCSDIACDITGRPTEGAGVDRQQQDAVAQDALRDEELWEGIDPRAQRAWVLVNVTGWTPTRAARYVGIHKRELRREFGTVLARLGARDGR